MTAQLIQTAEVSSPVKPGGSRAGLHTACDYIVAFGILGLVALSPLAPSTGDERALCFVEITVFFIPVLWIAKIFWMNAQGEPLQAPGESFRKLIVAIGALLLFFVLQMIPLPPAIIHIISPATYQVYGISLPGWPLSPPYSRFSAASKVNLPIWRPLSLCTEVTSREALRFTCLAALMIIAGFYPFGRTRSQENGFVRHIVLWIVAVGTTVALWGLLPVLVPELGDGENTLRASSPFFNADHFANYLAMTAPLTLAGALYPYSFVTKIWRVPFRVMSAVAFLFISCAIFMSLSRAGWIIWALGSFLLIWLISLSPSAARSYGNRRFDAVFERWGRIVIGGAIALLFLMCTSFLMGSRGDQLMAERLRDTGFNDPSFTSRAQVWKASVAMWNDFPIVGVGLDSWPEIFGRYQIVPYDRDTFWGEAHNDYVQFAAETGIVGVALFAWFWLMFAVYLSRGRATLSADSVPLYVALLTGIIAMSAHEFADFSFRETPNAVLFCVLAGIAFRISRTTKAADVERALPSWKLVAVGTGAGALIVVSAMAGTAVAYPHDVYSGESAAQRRPSAEAVPTLARLAAAHPGRADTHLAMGHVLKREKRWIELDREIDSAMWLQPTNPIARDWYAYRLEQSGQIPEALSEITRSVYLVPNPDSHSYLGDRNQLLRLTDGEKAAVEKGLKAAADEGNQRAIEELSQFQIELGRLDDAAANYDAAATHESEPELKNLHFLKAGRVYVQSGKLDLAERAFANVLNSDPQNQPAYQALIELLVREKNTAAVNRLLDEATQNGVEASPLWSAYAQAAESAGDPSTAEHAARVALQNRPSDLTTMRLLGSLYLQHGKFAQASATFEDLTEIDPDSAEDFYMLGISQENDYQYDAADSAFRKAVSLRPNDTGLSTHYREFQARLKQSSADMVAP